MLALTITLSLIITTIILFIYLWSHRYYKKESLYIGDQMAMNHPDPLYLYYFGRRKDLLGLSHRDYYLENQLLAESGVLPFYKDMPGAKYANLYGYSSLPKAYRPKQAISFIELEDD